MTQLKRKLCSHVFEENVEFSLKLEFSVPFTRDLEFLKVAYHMQLFIFIFGVLSP